MRLNAFSSLLREFISTADGNLWFSQLIQFDSQYSFAYGYQKLHFFFPQEFPFFHEYQGVHVSEQEMKGNSIQIFQ